MTALATQFPDAPPAIQAGGWNAGDVSTSKSTGRWRKFQGLGTREQATYDDDGRPVYREADGHWSEGRNRRQCVSALASSFASWLAERDFHAWCKVRERDTGRATVAFLLRSIVEAGNADVLDAIAAGVRHDWGVDGGGEGESAGESQSERRTEAYAYALAVERAASVDAIREGMLRDLWCASGVWHGELDAEGVKAMYRRYFG